MLSILIAILLEKTGAISHILSFTFGSVILTSFLAGIFFVSFFTAAPAAVVLIALGRTQPIFTIAFFSSFGAILGDLLIFRFIEDSVSHDIAEFVKHSKAKKLLYIFRSRPLRWLGAILGALIIASPLPDDLGLILMGFSKVKQSVFIPLFFVLNFIGILSLTYIFK